MTRFACPACGETLEITQPGPTDHRRAVAAVEEFLASTPHGRYQTTALRRMYEQRRDGHGWPALGHRSFGVALQAAGGRRVRTSNWRGWEL